VVVAAPSSLPAVSAETTTEDAPDCRSRCTFSDSRTDATMWMVGRHLPSGQRDENGGVVAVGRHHDRLGQRHTRDAQHARPRGVARHRDEPRGRGGVELGVVGVDDDDLAGSAPSPSSVSTAARPLVP
jgi:hypothetical protein